MPISDCQGGILALDPGETRASLMFWKKLFTTSTFDLKLVFTHVVWMGMLL